MAEKAKSKSQQSKGQPSPRRGAQVALPRARLTQEGTVRARPVRDPSTAHRPSLPAPAAPSASVRSRTLTTGHRPRVSVTQGTLGSATATQGSARNPGDSPEPSQRRVRVARLTEAGLRKLGGISTHQRVLEWLESTLASRDEAMTELEEELEKQLQEELKEYWESLERESNEGGEDP